MDDETLDRKERRIPVAANAAFRAAFEATLKAGHGVLSVEDGKLLRFLPDGRRKRVEPRRTVEFEGKVPVLRRTAFPD